VPIIGICHCGWKWNFQWILGNIRGCLWFLVDDLRWEKSVHLPKMFCVKWGGGRGNWQEKSFDGVARELNFCMFEFELVF
jgi:hypothetical protein